MPAPTPTPPRRAARGRAAALVVAVLCTLAAEVPLATAAEEGAPTDATATTATTVAAEDGAPRRPATAAERQQLEEDLAEVTAEERRLGADLAAAEAERTRLAGLLVEAAGRVAVAVRELEAGEAVLAEATAELGIARRRLDATERALDEAVAELQDQAVDSFIGGREESIGALLDREDLRELGAAATYRDVVIEHQDGVVGRVTRLRRTLELAARRAVVAQRSATQAVQAAEAQRRVVQAERDELASLETASVAAVQAHSALLAEVQVRKARYEAELAALVQVSDSLAGALAARQAGQVAGTAQPGTFVLPVPSARLSSRFGPRIHPIFGTSRLHAGMDMAAPTGTAVGAAGVGTVVTARVLGGYGNAVVVDHGGGLSTLYAHLSAIDVAVGDAVGAGQLIGRVGSTGNSTGPHLHFEVRVLGTPVDPLGYL